MRKDPVAAEHVAFADRKETNGAGSVERLLAQGKLIDVRRRRAAMLEADGAWIVPVAAEAGMRLQPVPVRQVDGAGRNIIDRGTAVGIRR